MSLTWKSFDFFEASTVQLADDETRPFFEGNETACVCAGSESFFLGSFSGWVRIVGPSWKVVQSWRAYDEGEGAITHMRQVEGTSLLVTVAEDMISEPALKVWALDKLDPKSNMPTCLSTLRINNARKQFPISAFAILPDLSQVAVGFANGSVTLARGDLVNDLGTRQRVVHESDDPVTGLEMVFDPRTSTTTLLIGTVARVLRLAVPKRGQALPPRTAEDIGCDVGCMTRDPRSGSVVVARTDALYYYGIEAGRGHPRGYESEKRKVVVWGDYVVVVCPPVKEEGGGSGRRRGLGGAMDAWGSTETLLLLEGDLRVVGHSEAMLPVKGVVQLWGNLFVLTQDGKVRRYHEKTLQQRLEMLYQRNMYPLAIDLAQKSGMDAAQQSTIYRKFGDHLYQRNDYDGAMMQYIRAIDTTEPSQVIRKFLDTQRIHNLIQYLEQLHDRRKATADHTTLLLNCYAKLKDIDKLENFIKSPGDLKFDLETAISMCRQGGYFEQAAYLAKQHGETDLVVDILIEDSKAYDEALDYIWRQEVPVAYGCLQKYARVLIEHCPKDATQIFVDYYTGRYRPRTGPIASETVPDEVPASPSGAFAGAASAVQNLSSFFPPLPYMSSSPAPTPSSTKQNQQQQQQQQPLKDAAAVSQTTPLPLLDYTPPPPRTAFSSFIDHPDEFITFLEACLEDKHLADSDRTDLYTTLFEMYLAKANEKDRGTAHREKWEAKAKELIAGDDVPMESSNVLLLSHLSSFVDGTVLVKEQSGLLFDIFRSYTSAKDVRGALAALKKYGPTEPQLYPAALAFLASDTRVLEEAGREELDAVLGVIEARKLMAPLQVVQTLVGRPGASSKEPSKEGVATVGLIKPYLQRTIEREKQEISTNRRLMADYRAETEQIARELEDLSTKPTVFQATRCSDCRGTLDLPAVHFLCKHSFHRRCLRGRGEDDDGLDEGRGGEAEQQTGETMRCPQCSGKNDVIRAYRVQQMESGQKHDVFMTDLEASKDKFGTVAEWFRRGVMGAAAE